jgi:uncharacterized membrane protein YbhN (UPF0104 family)
MGKRWVTRKNTSSALTLVALMSISLFIWWRRDEFASFALISPLSFALCLVSTTIFLAANGLVLRVLVNRVGGQIRTLDALSLSIVSTAANIFVPAQGGTVGRAIYLKQRHGFNYSTFLITLIACQMLMLIVSCMFGTVALAWMSFTDQRLGLSKLLIFSISFLTIAILACLLPMPRIRGNRVLDKIDEIFRGWCWLREQPVFVLQLALLTSIQVMADVLSFWMACTAVGIQLGFVEAMAVVGLANLASILNITPGSIGIYEAAVAFVGSTLAVAPAQSVMAALATRAALFAVLVVLTPLALLIIRREAPLRTCDTDRGRA